MSLLSNKIYDSCSSAELYSNKNKNIKEIDKNISTPIIKDIKSFNEKISEKQKCSSTYPLISKKKNIINNNNSNEDYYNNNYFNSVSTTQSISIDLINISNDFFKNIQEIVLPQNSKKFDLFNDNFDDLSRIFDNIINEIKLLKNMENIYKKNIFEVKVEINDNNFLATFIKEASKKESKNEEEIKLKKFEKIILDLASENKNFKKEINELKNKIKLLNKKNERKIKVPIKQNNISNVNNIYRNKSFDINKKKNQNFKYNNLKNMSEFYLNTSPALKKCTKPFKKLILEKKNKLIKRPEFNISLFKKNLSQKSLRNNLNKAKEYIPNNNLKSKRIKININ